MEICKQDQHELTRKTMKPKIRNSNLNWTQHLSSIDNVKWKKQWRINWKKKHSWKEGDIIICKKSKLEKVKVETKKLNKLFRNISMDITELNDLIYF